MVFSHTKIKVVPILAGKKLFRFPNSFNLGSFSDSFFLAVNVSDVVDI